MDKQTVQKILKDLENLNAKDGLDLAEMLFVSDDLRQLLRWMVKKNRFQADELAEHLSVDPATSDQLMTMLLRKGFLQAVDDESTEFRVVMKAKRSYQVPKKVWKALED